MAHSNVEYLKNQLRFNGFGISLFNQLERMLQSGNPQVSMLHQVNFQEDLMAVQLNFRKSDQTGNYFFNSYVALLKKNNINIKQVFFVNNNNSVTLREAYNLLSGRSVLKELVNKQGDLQKVWVQLDFKNKHTNGNYLIQHFHENYGFDLEKNLEKYPIKEMQDPEKFAHLVKILQKGNPARVHLINGDQEIEYIIEASPRFLNLNIYDNTMRRVDADALRISSTD